MKIAFLLHFYQPHDQQADILDRIVRESYRPLVEGLLARTHAKVTINITGALTKLLEEHGYQDILVGIKKLLDRGQIEMTGSCMYHAFLPLIPKEEAVRQIELNNELHKNIYGESYSPVGFFSPEMAVSNQVLDLVDAGDYKWISVPQVASVTGQYSPDKLYSHQNIKIFFRNKRVSSLILSSVVRDSDSLINETKDLHNSDKYWFCVMDAETFGHHRIGHEKVLFDILDNKFFESTLPSELINDLSYDVDPTELRDCTWTNSEQDFHLIKGQNSFVLWKDPENPIHSLQWEFTNYVVNLMKTHDNDEARKLLDSALASDHFWWASVKPWWSLEMVEQGAHNLKKVALLLDSSDLRAEKYYRDIMDLAFEWQRSGLIRKKHLENSATHMKEPFKDRAPTEWYNQIVLEFEDEMTKAAANRDFEKAIKWRDALIKLDQKTDICDVLHVVDELWSARQIPSVKPFLEHNWDELSDFAKEYLQEVKSESELEDWKKEKQSNA